MAKKPKINYKARIVECNCSLTYCDRRATVGTRSRHRQKTRIVREAQELEASKNLASQAEQKVMMEHEKTVM